MTATDHGDCARRVDCAAGGGQPRAPGARDGAGAPHSWSMDPPAVSW